MDIIAGSGMLADNYQAMLLGIGNANGEELRKIAKKLAGKISACSILAISV
jgi:hypothetical protein